MGKNIHVKKQGSNCWIVIGDGDKIAFSIHTKRSTALNVATTIAKNQHSQVIIHRADGKETKKSPMLRFNTLL